MGRLLAKKKSNQTQSNTALNAIEPHAIIPADQFHDLLHLVCPYTVQVIKRLKKSGFMAFLVGGGVRDLLLGLPPKDFDISTDAHPEAVKKCFRNCRLIGRRFRLAHVYFGQTIVEVATFRASTNQHASQSLSQEGIILRDNVYGTIVDDAWRRDLTINALYYDIDQNFLVDYTGGFQDIQRKLVRIIGNPMERYREDPVRMLRVIRFAAKLDFAIEMHTAQAIASSKHLLTHMAQARLYEEVLKLFHTGYAKKVYMLAQQYQLFEVLFPQTQSEDDLLLQQIFQNTDERLTQDKPVSAAFLFTALLWSPISRLAEQFKAQGLPIMASLERAIAEVLQHQRQIIAIPKRFSRAIADICLLQYRLLNRRGKRAWRILANPKFRAGYDLLLVRASVGLADPQLAQWWTEFQRVNLDTQKHMVQAL